jgi:hypothetical protein
MSALRHYNGRQLFIFCLTAFVLDFLNHPSLGNCILQFLTLYNMGFQPVKRLLRAACQVLFCSLPRL